MNRKQLQRMRDELDITGNENGIMVLQGNINSWTSQLHGMRIDFETLRDNIMLVRTPAGDVSEHAFGLVSDIKATYEKLKKVMELRIKNTMDLMGRKQVYIDALKKLIKLKK